MMPDKASQRFLGSIMPKRSCEAAAVNLVRIPPRQFDNAADGRCYSTLPNSPLITKHRLMI